MHRLQYYKKILTWQCFFSKKRATFCICRSFSIDYFFINFTKFVLFFREQGKVYPYP